jgi:hypothetical protein
MPKNNKNSKNSPRGNSFELLSESNDDESITVETSSEAHAALRTQLAATGKEDQLDQSRGSWFLEMGGKKMEAMLNFGKGQRFVCRDYSG